jgi:small nuclear ribonucleoprotein (snRNP)-like protein
MSSRLIYLSRIGVVSCISLILLCVCNLAPPLQAAQDSSGKTKELVAVMGIGTPVYITPSSGEEIRGVIREIGDDQFAIASGDQPVRHIGYGQVRSLRLVNEKYRAIGETDTVVVRRILNVVGTGKHVLVKTRDSRKMRGTIEMLDEDQFTLRIGSRSLDIGYQQVAEVEPKALSTGAKIAIIAGAAAGTFIVFTILTILDAAR